MRNKMIGMTGIMLCLGLSSAAMAAPSTNNPADASRYPSTTAPGTSSASSPSDSTPATDSTMNSQEFSKLDVDGDGNVSRREGGKNKDVKKQWSKLDANKDGKLDAMEFSQFEIAPMGDTKR